MSPLNQNSTGTPRRTLGAGGPVVGAVGLGCMGMSWVYAEQSQDQADLIRALRQAVESGITLLDTSDIYGPYTNEDLVGRAIVGIRDKVVLATKGGLIARAGAHIGDVTTKPDGRPEHLRAACEGSLKRLGVDDVDLYYLHRVDPRVPLAESWGALAELQSAGKVRHIGLSEVTVEQLALAHEIATVTAVQSELSLWTTDPLDQVLPWCTAHGVAFVPFSPLGRGFLTGRFTTENAPATEDFRSRMPRFQPEALTVNQRILDGVRAVAARHHVTPGQVALAWTLAQGEHVVPIPGGTKTAHIQENAAAAELTLTAQDFIELDELPAAVGTRY